MDDKLIDIKEIYTLFKKKFWIIFVVTLITTGIGFYKTTTMLTSYQGFSKVFVGKGDTLLNYYPEMEIKYYTELMNTFNEVIKLDDSLNDSLKNSNSNKTAEEVRGGITITGSQKSPIFTITYTSLNNDGIKEVIDAVTNEFSEYIKNMMPDTKPKVIDEARIYPITPNKERVMLIGFAVGIILSIGIILVLDYLDDTIKSRERLEKILPIPVLGELPKHDKSFKGE
ncbi:MAG: YveK family protein [Clostridium sp.]